MCSCWCGIGSAVSGCLRKRDNGSVTPSSGQEDSPAPENQHSNGKNRPSFSDSVNGSIPSSPRITDEIRRGSNLRVFCFGELRSATRNFRPDSLLGEGGFGHVFKGWIDENGTVAVRPGTGLTVAVKQLNPEGYQGDREWLAEVNFLGQLHHFNLVRLVGYCVEDDHRLLVYEFMPRGSLENHLFRSRALPLSWAIRMKIALGAAQGLAFLHQEAVIYRDFKTSNILLDHDYTSKLSDFGLAKDGPEGDKTHVSTRIMGTYGYAAPEYVMTGHLTAKSDVYSFGVVLLEMLTGRRSMDKARGAGEQNLVEWARPYIHDKRRVHRIVDPRMEHYPLKSFQKASALACQCLTREAKSRPDMKEVVRQLEALQVTSDITGQLQPSNSYNHQRHHQNQNQNQYQNRNQNPNQQRPIIINGHFSRHQHQQQQQQLQQQQQQQQQHSHGRTQFPPHASAVRYQQSPRRSPMQVK